MTTRLLVVYVSVLLLIPFMKRVRSELAARARESAEPIARDPGLPAPTD